MKVKNLNVLGVMTGTSFDGMDISIIKTNGTSVSEFKNNYYFPYPKHLFNKLQSLFELKNNFNCTEPKIFNLETLITKEIKKNIKKIIKNEKIDLIGIHGQTIYHQPSLKKSVQLGDGQIIANELDKIVVNNFRLNDILNGGQGAPIAPIFHKYLIESLNIDLPSCFINIGGISNLTYLDKDNLIGFDTGPGNYLSDSYMQIKFDKKFDNFGKLAMSGKINTKIVNYFLKDKFFKIKPPKSLDKNYFIKRFNEILKYKLTHINFMASICEITALSISKSLKFLPNSPKNIICAGGGTKNLFIMNQLKKHIKCNFLGLKEFGLDEDFIESQLIAFLAARRVNELPITFPETTGVEKPLIGGDIKIPTKTH